MKCLKKLFSCPHVFWVHVLRLKNFNEFLRKMPDLYIKLVLGTTYDSHFAWKAAGMRKLLMMGRKRRLQKKELYTLYSPRNIFRTTNPRRMRWEGHEALTGVIKFLVENPERKRQLRRPRCGWEGNIKIRWCERLNGSADSGLDLVAGYFNMIMNFRVL